MSSIIVPNEGELKLLAWMLKDTGQDTVLKLYRNNYTPDQNATEASFTEANFTNYAAMTLVRATWQAPVMLSAKALALYADQTWTAGSSQTIYGYWVSQGGTCLWAEKFDSSRALSNGTILTVSPQLTLRSEN